jgi:hypothetical protein
MECAHTDLQAIEEVLTEARRGELRPSELDHAVECVQVQLSPAVVAQIHHARARAWLESDNDLQAASSIVAAWVAAPDARPRGPYVLRLWWHRLQHEPTPASFPLQGQALGDIPVWVDGQPLQQPAVTFTSHVVQLPLADGTWRTFLSDGPLLPGLVEAEVSEAALPAPTGFELRLNRPLQGGCWRDLQETGHVMLVLHRPSPWRWVAWLGPPAAGVALTAAFFAASQ